VIIVETLAFYSYIGGVGRSLLLAYAARFLATLGAGVVALDLDVEAPGLHYGLARRHVRRQKLAIRGGAVPYLVATARGAASPPSLEEHVVEAPLPPNASGWLHLMPAGPAPDRAYWIALKELGEKLRLEDPSGQGVMAVLDLQGRIEDELKPDYLLIEAPSGVTPLGGLVTSILADAVVCTLEMTRESIEGTLAVVEALRAASRPTGRSPVRVVPVLSNLKRPIDQIDADDLERLFGNEPAPSIDEHMLESEMELAGATGTSAFHLELLHSLFPSFTDRNRPESERQEAG
jgi:Mrp family chromosome partitioning ATPase